MSGENLAANNDRFGPIRSIATELGVTPGQLALAWLLHQHPSVVPIPGSRRPEHISENNAAATITLPDSLLARIDAAREKFRPAGATIMDTSGATPR